MQEAVDDPFQLTRKRFCIHFFVNGRPKHQLYQIMTPPSSLSSESWTISYISAAIPYLRF